MSNLIYTPKHKSLELEIAMPPTGMEGRYGFKKYKAATMELVQEVNTVPNLITNAGLIMAGTGWYQQEVVFVGTGSAAPQVTDTTLQNYRARTATMTGSWNPKSATSPVPGEWVEGTGTWRFNTGAASGNITEVGYGRLDDNSGPVYTLFSRALVVDANGNPTTITVLADEILDVTYTLRIYCPTEEVDTILTLSGVNYNMKIGRWNSSDTGTWPAYYGSGIMSPTGAGNIASTYAVAFGSNSPITFAGDITSGTPFSSNASPASTNFAVNTVQEPANFGALATFSARLQDANFPKGIRGLTWLRGNNTNGQAGLHLANYRALFDPPIPKNNTNILSFGLRWTWGRYTAP